MTMAEKTSWKERARSQAIVNERAVHDARRAMAHIPCGMWVMSSCFEGKRAGVIVKSVSPCADEPLLLAVAAWKGHGIEPIIRDSHHFAVSLIEPEDRLLIKKFSGNLSDHPDQFDAIATDRLVSGAPVLAKSRLAFDCEVVRHFDMEADHELYIGLVLGSRVHAPGSGGAGAHRTNGHAGGPGGSSNGHSGPHTNGHGHANGHAPGRHGPHQS